MSPSRVPDRITCLAPGLVAPLRYKRLSPDFMYKRRPGRRRGRGLSGVSRKEWLVLEGRGTQGELRGCGAGLLGSVLPVQE